MDVAIRGSEVYPAGFGTPGVFVGAEDGAVSGGGGCEPTPPKRGKQKNN